MSDALSQLEVYNFIHKSIRNEDKKTGYFLKRFFDGPQQVWGATEQKIFDIKKLWDLENIDNEYLQYIQDIVGWVGDRKKITEALDYDTLRRLIGVSITLWRDRGPEDTMVAVLRLTTKSQVRIWNWFDNRWLVEENYITEEHQDIDSLIVDLPSQSSAEHESDLHIVDNGTLNKALVRDLVKLMRACGERYLIAYVSFMEMFTVDNDYHQWDLSASADLIVANGVGTLENTAIPAETVIVNVSGSLNWSNYLAYFKIKAKEAPAGTDLVGYGVYSNASGSNCYYIYLNIYNNSVGVTKRYNNDWYSMGGSSIVDYDPWGVLKSDVFYGIRTQIFPDGSNTRIKVYVDGDEIVNVIDQSAIGSPYTEGTICAIRRGDAEMEFDDVELFELPLDTDLIDVECPEPIPVEEVPIYMYFDCGGGGTITDVEDEMINYLASLEPGSIVDYDTAVALASKHAACTFYDLYWSLTGTDPQDPDTNPDWHREDIVMEGWEQPVTNADIIDFGAA